MGSVLVTKFHVEFDAETVFSTADEFAEEMGISYDAQNVVVTTIASPLVEGWYQYTARPFGNVVFWEAEVLEDMDAAEFLETHVRVHPPVPWTDTSNVEEDSKYTDGYYRTYDGIHYRRIDGEWSWSWQGGDVWFDSTYSDENIENPEDGVVFVPED
jgi:hypothetical protein